jgi:DNA polymerase III sliding clamp (beta) subunit (PCNA family)
MQIDRKFKIEKAVSTDPTRENLQNVFVSRRHAMATDGKILAIVPVQCDKDDEAGSLTPEALKLARKVSGKGLDPIRIGLNGAQILSDGTVMTRPDECKPPRIFHLLRKAYQGKYYRIGINAAYLKDLADALGSEELVLECGNSTEAVMVHPLNQEEGCVGLIMPIRLNDKRR